MRSTFMGLETARRGMFTQQGALYTTGHNIANASTPGYTRQRVNFEQTEPYPGKGMNMPQIPGQMGTGVKEGSIQRVRESFLDTQYRAESNKLGYWQSRSEALSKMEEIMNEPSDEGLSKTMDQFWQSLQDLAVDPTNQGARSVVRQRGIAVSETFNYLYNSLTDVKMDQKNEIDVAVKEINTLVYQLIKINDDIGSVEPHGYLPNDLYDERDRLIDQLSSLVNIKVQYVKSGGKPDEKAEGKAIIKLVSDSGTEKGILLSDTSYNQVELRYDGQDSCVKTIKIGNSSFNFSDMKSSGKLKALVESYGYEDVSGKVIGVYPDMLNELDNMAYTFAKEFNDVHASGLSPNEISAGKNEDIPFFSGASKADVAFIIDNTGSMSGPINNVQTNINGFVNMLKDQGIQANLGLVTYGEKGEAGGDPAKNALTTDVSKFLEYVNSIALTGGGDTPESGLEAIMDPANGAVSYNSEAGNLKHIVLVTDAPVHDVTDGKSTYDIAAVADALEKKGIRLHVVTDLSNTQLEGLSEPTGGLFIDINSPSFGSELQKIATNITNDLGSKKGYAGRIAISESIQSSLDNIATASGIDPSKATLGDSTNVTHLADVINEKFEYSSNQLSDFRNYYQNVIGGMAVISQEATRLTTNSSTLQQSVDQKRQSVSSVSLDEEMTNMIQFQQAYNASARMISIQDEMLDKIINGMGTGGR